MTKAESQTQLEYIQATQLWLGQQWRECNRLGLPRKMLRELKARHQQLLRDINILEKILDE